MTRRTDGHRRKPPHCPNCGHFVSKAGDCTRCGDKGRRFVPQLEADGTWMFSRPSIEIVPTQSSTAIEIMPTKDATIFQIVGAAEILGLDITIDVRRRGGKP